MKHNKSLQKNNSKDAILTSTDRPSHAGGQLADLAAADDDSGGSAAAHVAAAVKLKRRS
jgi:hypothetical protein